MLPLTYAPNPQGRYCKYFLRWEKRTNIRQPERERGSHWEKLPFRRDAFPLSATMRQSNKPVGVVEGIKERKSIITSLKTVSLAFTTVSQALEINETTMNPYLKKFYSLTDERGNKTFLLNSTNAIHILEW